jgi:hypothetical protein
MSWETSWVARETNSATEWSAESLRGAVHADEPLRADAPSRVDVLVREIVSVIVTTCFLVSSPFRPLDCLGVSHFSTVATRYPGACREAPRRDRAGRGVA